MLLKNDTLSKFLDMQFLIFLPIVVIWFYIASNPNVILLRGNDLTEFFWPLIAYIKDSIQKYHQIPLWNNLFFAGTPLITDPQSPTWYFPNIIFLLMDIQKAFVVSIILHSILSMVGVYLTSKKVFHFSKTTTLFLSVFYALSPIYFSFLEAGHWGLIICWSWLPLLILSAYVIATKPSLKYAILFSLSASSIYFGHVLTAAIALFSVCIYWLYKRKFVWTTVTGLMTILIIGPAFVLQFNWQNITTRDLLLISPEIYPIWLGKLDFIKSFLLFTPETEKSITFGIIPTIVSIFGFLKLRRRLKIIILGIILLPLLVVLGTASPIYELLLNIPLFVLMRVSIRPWFVIYLVLLFLLANGLERIKPTLRYILIFCALLEMFMIATLYIAKPNLYKPQLPKEVYEYLASDRDIFEVYCTTRCFSQKESEYYGLHLAEGYGTLQQRNYLDASQQIGQYYWRKYSLFSPPPSIYLYTKLQPFAPSLADYGIKYAVSPHKLIDKNLKLVFKSNEFFVYKNGLYKHLDYITYTPNHIRLNILDSKNIFNIPIIFNPNWQTYDNLGKRLQTVENSSHTISVEINEDTKYIDLFFEPFSFAH